eukprot:Nk52_evm5s1271 gene=Nk52_evmTU5s1271
MQGVFVVLILHLVSLGGLGGGHWGVDPLEGGVFVGASSPLCGKQFDPSTQPLLEGKRFTSLQEIAHMIGADPRVVFMLNMQDGNTKPYPPDVIDKILLMPLPIIDQQNLLHLPTLPSLGLVQRPVVVPEDTCKSLEAIYPARGAGRGAGHDEEDSTSVLVAGRPPVECSVLLDLLGVDTVEEYRGLGNLGECGGEASCQGENGWTDVLYGEGNGYDGGGQDGWHHQSLFSHGNGRNSYCREVFKKILEEEMMTDDVVGNDIYADMSPHEGQDGSRLRRSLTILRHLQAKGERREMPERVNFGESRPTRGGDLPYSDVWPEKKMASSFGIFKSLKFVKSTHPAHIVVISPSTSAFTEPEIGEEHTFTFPVKMFTYMPYAHIYFTVDGSHPLYSPTRKKYTGPVRLEQQIQYTSSLQSSASIQDGENSHKSDDIVGTKAKASGPKKSVGVLFRAVAVHRDSKRKELKHTPISQVMYRLSRTMNMYRIHYSAFYNSMKSLISEKTNVDSFFIEVVNALLSFGISPGDATVALGSSSSGEYPIEVVLLISQILFATDNMFAPIENDNVPDQLLKPCSGVSPSLNTNRPNFDVTRGLPGSKTLKASNVIELTLTGLCAYFQASSATELKNMNSLLDDPGSVYMDMEKGMKIAIWQWYRARPSDSHSSTSFSLASLGRQGNVRKVFAYLYGDPSEYCTSGSNDVKLKTGADFEKRITYYRLARKAFKVPHAATEVNIADTDCSSLSTVVSDYILIHPVGESNVCQSHDGDAECSEGERMRAVNNFDLSNCKGAVCKCCVGSIPSPRALYSKRQSLLSKSKVTYSRQLVLSDGSPQKYKGYSCMDEQNYALNGLETFHENQLGSGWVYASCKNETSCVPLVDCLQVEENQSRSEAFLMANTGTPYRRGLCTGRSNQVIYENVALKANADICQTDYLFTNGRFGHMCTSRINYAIILTSNLDFVQAQSLCEGYGYSVCRLSQMQEAAKVGYNGGCGFVDERESNGEYKQVKVSIDGSVVVCRLPTKKTIHLEMKVHCCKDSKFNEGSVTFEKGLKDKKSFYIYSNRLEFEYQFPERIMNQKTVYSADIKTGNDPYILGGVGTTITVSPPVSVLDAYILIFFKDLLPLPSFLREPMMRMYSVKEEDRNEPNIMLAPSLQVEYGSVDSVSKTVSALVKLYKSGRFYFAYAQRGETTCSTPPQKPPAGPTAALGKGATDFLLGVNEIDSLKFHFIFPDMVKGSSNSFQAQIMYAKDPYVLGYQGFVPTMNVKGTENAVRATEKITIDFSAVLPIPECQHFDSLKLYSIDVERITAKDLLEVTSSLKEIKGLELNLNSNILTLTTAIDFSVKDRFYFVYGKKSLSLGGGQVAHLKYCPVLFPEVFSLLQGEGSMCSRVAVLSPLNRPQLSSPKSVKAYCNSMMTSPSSTFPSTVTDSSADAVGVVAHRLNECEQTEMVYARFEFAQGIDGKGNVAPYRTACCGDIGGSSRLWYTAEYGGHLSIRNGCTVVHISIPPLDNEISDNSSSGSSSLSCIYVDLEQYHGTFPFFLDVIGNVGFRIRCYDNGEYKIPSRVMIQVLISYSDCALSSSEEQLRGAMNSVPLNLVGVNGKMRIYPAFNDEDVEKPLVWNDEKSRLFISNIYLHGDEDIDAFVLAPAVVYHSRGGIESIKASLNCFHLTTCSACVAAGCGYCTKPGSFSEEYTFSSSQFCLPDKEPYTALSNLVCATDGSERHTCPPTQTIDESEIYDLQIGAVDQISVKPLGLVTTEVVYSVEFILEVLGSNFDEIDSHFKAQFSVDVIILHIKNNARAKFTHSGTAYFEIPATSQKGDKISSFEIFTLTFTYTAMPGFMLAGRVIAQINSDNSLQEYLYNNVKVHTPDFDILALGLIMDPVYPLYFIKGVPPCVVYNARILGTYQRAYVNMKWKLDNKDIIQQGLSTSIPLGLSFYDPKTKDKLTAGVHTLNAVLSYMGHEMETKVIFYVVNAPSSISGVMEGSYKDSSMDNCYDPGVPSCMKQRNNAEDLSDACFSGDTGIYAAIHDPTFLSIFSSVVDFPFGGGWGRKSKSYAHLSYTTDGAVSMDSGGETRLIIPWTTIVMKETRHLFLNGHVDALTGEPYLEITKEIVSSGSHTRISTEQMVGCMPYLIVNTKDTKTLITYSSPSPNEIKMAPAFVSRSDYPYTEWYAEFGLAFSIGWGGLAKLRISVGGSIYHREQVKSYKFPPNVAPTGLPSVECESCVKTFDVGIVIRIDAWTLFIHIVHKRWQPFTGSAGTSCGRKPCWNSRRRRSLNDNSNDSKCSKAETQPGNTQSFCDYLEQVKYNPDFNPEIIDRSTGTIRDDLSESGYFAKGVVKLNTYHLSFVANNGIYRMFSVASGIEYNPNACSAEHMMLMGSYFLPQSATTPFVSVKFKSSKLSESDPHISQRYLDNDICFRVYSISSTTTDSSSVAENGIETHLIWADIPCEPPTVELSLNQAVINENVDSMLPTLYIHTSHAASETPVGDRDVQVILGVAVAAKDLSKIAGEAHKKSFSLYVQVVPNAQDIAAVKAISKDATEDRATVYPNRLNTHDVHDVSNLFGKQSETDYKENPIIKTIGWDANGEKGVATFVVVEHVKVHSHEGVEYHQSTLQYGLMVLKVYCVQMHPETVTKTVGNTTETDTIYSDGTCDNHAAPHYFTTGSTVSLAVPFKNIQAEQLSAELKKLELVTGSHSVLVSQTKASMALLPWSVDNNRVILVCWTEKVTDLSANSIHCSSGSDERKRYTQKVVCLLIENGGGKTVEQKVDVSYVWGNLNVDLSSGTTFDNIHVSTEPADVSKPNENPLKLPNRFLLSFTATVNGGVILTMSGFLLVGSEYGKGIRDKIFASPSLATPENVVGYAESKGHIFYRNLGPSSTEMFFMQMERLAHESSTGSKTGTVTDEDLKDNELNISFQVASAYQRVEPTTVVVQDGLEDNEYPSDYKPSKFKGYSFVLVIENTGTLPVTCSANKPLEVSVLMGDPSTAMSEVKQVNDLRIVTPIAPHESVKLKGGLFFSKSRPQGGIDVHTFIRFKLVDKHDLLAQQHNKEVLGKQFLIHNSKITLMKVEPVPNDPKKFQVVVEANNVLPYFFTDSLHWRLYKKAVEGQSGWQAIANADAKLTIQSDPDAERVPLQDWDSTQSYASVSSGSLTFRAVISVPEDVPGNVQGTKWNVLTPYQPSFMYMDVPEQVFSPSAFPPNVHDLVVLSQGKITVQSGSSSLRRRRSQSVGGGHEPYRPFDREGMFTIADNSVWLHTSIHNGFGPRSTHAVVLAFPATKSHHHRSHSNDCSHWRDVWEHHNRSITHTAPWEVLAGSSCLDKMIFASDRHINPKMANSTDDWLGNEDECKKTESLVEMDGNGEHNRASFNTLGCNGNKRGVVSSRLTGKLSQWIPSHAILLAEKSVSLPAFSQTNVSVSLLEGLIEHFRGLSSVKSPGDSKHEHLGPKYSPGKFDLVFMVNHDMSGADEQSVLDNYDVIKNVHLPFKKPMNLPGLTDGPLSVDGFHVCLAPEQVVFQLDNICRYCDTSAIENSSWHIDLAIITVFITLRRDPSQTAGYETNIWGETSCRNFESPSQVVSVPIEAGRFEKVLKSEQLLDVHNSIDINIRYFILGREYKTSVRVSPRQLLMHPSARSKKDKALVKKRIRFCEKYQS